MGLISTKKTPDSSLGPSPRGHMRTQQESSILQPRGRSPPESSHADTLPDLGRLASRKVRNKFLLFYKPCSLLLWQAEWTETAGLCVGWEDALFPF